MTTPTNVNWIPKAELACSIMDRAIVKLEEALSSYGRGSIPTPQGERFAARGIQSVQTLKVVAKGLRNIIPPTKGDGTP